MAGVPLGVGAASQLQAHLCLQSFAEQEKPLADVGAESAPVAAAQPDSHEVSCRLLALTWTTLWPSTSQVCHCSAATASQQGWPDSNPPSPAETFEKLAFDLTIRKLVEAFGYPKVSHACKAAPLQTCQAQGAAHRH